MNVSIIGSGIVGTAIGEGLKELGNKVVFYDIDVKKIEEMKSKGHEATSDIIYAITNSDVSFVCVPTPTKEGKIDLTYIKSAIEDIGKALKNKDGYHVVVVKSTIVPTTTENIIIPILEKSSDKKAGNDFGVCANPEFLTEIANTWTGDDNFARKFFNEERIVVGELDKKSGDLMEKLYEKLGKPMFRTNLKTAEFIKYASNCCLASRISFWNEIFLISQKLGIDSNFVAGVVGMDKRIGKYGTVHGKAYGGKCLDKDMKAFISWAENYHDPVLLKAVDGINEKMRKDYGIRE